MSAQMNDLIELGPLVVKRGLLTLLAAIACGLLAIRISRRRLGPESIAALDVLLQAGLIVLLFWKFGHVLSAPAMLWERPQSLLLMSGAAREAVLGLVVAVAVTSYRARKQGMPLALILDAAAYGAIAAVAVYSLLQWRYGLPTSVPWGIGNGIGEERYHPVNVYMLLLTSFVAVRTWKLAAETGSGRLFRETAIVFGIGGLLISLFAARGETFLLYLSRSQLLYIALTLAGVIFSQLTHNTGRKELIAMQPKHDPNGDSLEQRNQEHKNAASPKQGGANPGIDKKLDGPNRPST